MIQELIHQAWDFSGVSDSQSLAAFYKSRYEPRSGFLFIHQVGVLIFLAIASVRNPTLREHDLIQALASQFPPCRTTYLDSRYCKYIEPSRHGRTMRSEEQNDSNIIASMDQGRQPGGRGMAAYTRAAAARLSSAPPIGVPSAGVSPPTFGCSQHEFSRELRLPDCRWCSLTVTLRGSRLHQSTVGEINNHPLKH